MSEISNITIRAMKTHQSPESHGCMAEAEATMENSKTLFYFLDWNKDRISFKVSQESIINSYINGVDEPDCLLDTSTIDTKNWNKEYLFFFQLLWSIVTLINSEESYEEDGAETNENCSD